MIILLGLFMIGIGLAMTIKTEGFLKTFGRGVFFEKYLGTEGGSRLGYKLLGIVLVIIGVLVATGAGPDMLYWLFSPLLKYNKI